MDGGRGHREGRSERCRALRNGLSDNTKNSLEAIEGLNHLFQHCQTGSPNKYRDIEETFAPEVLEKLIQWISEQ